MPTRSVQGLHAAPLARRLVISVPDILAQGSDGGYHSKRAGNNNKRRHGRGKGHIDILAPEFLGEGRNGTILYSGASLPFLRPHMVGLCVWRYQDTHHTDYQRRTCVFVRSGIDSSALFRELRRVGFDSDLAVKDIPNTRTAQRECHLHAMLHSWFASRNALSRTPLMPDVACADVLMPNRFSQGHRTSGSKDGVSEPFDRRRLILYKRMHGSLRALRPMRPAEVWRAAEGVLHGLVVLHANHHIHTDVKPDNILYELARPQREVAASNQAAQQPPRPRVARYVLADYGLMADEATVQRMARSGYPSGTPGFISPLLLSDDSDNYVYPIFEDVATHAGTGAPHAPGGSGKWAVQAWWEEHFADCRSRLLRHPSMTHKADLHSLGLTLIDLFRPHNRPETVPATSIAHLDVQLLRFIERLLMLRDADLWSAEDALAVAQAAAAHVVASGRPSAKQDAA